MKSVITRAYAWWIRRFERRYKEAYAYYNQQSKEALVAEYIELQVKQDKSSRRRELLVGLVLTIIFSDDLKRIFAILFSAITGIAPAQLKESMLMSVIITLLIVLLMLMITIYNFSRSLLVRRYLILKQYLEENKK